MMVSTLETRRRLGGFVPGDVAGRQTQDDAGGAASQRTPRSKRVRVSLGDCEAARRRRPDGFAKRQQVDEMFPPFRAGKRILQCRGIDSIRRR